MIAPHVIIVLHLAETVRRHVVTADAVRPQRGWAGSTSGQSTGKATAPCGWDDWAGDPRRAVGRIAAIAGLRTGSSNNSTSKASGFMALSSSLAEGRIAFRLPKPASGFRVRREIEVLSTTFIDTCRQYVDLLRQRAASYVGGCYPRPLCKRALGGSQRRAKACILRVGQIHWLSSRLSACRFFEERPLRSINWRPRSMQPTFLNLT